MKRSGKILLEGTIEEFKKHCKGADNREYLLINTKEIKKDGTYAIYQLDSNTERVISISNKGKYAKGANATISSETNGISEELPVENATE